MIRAVNYCSCGRMMEQIKILIILNKKETAVLSQEFCPYCRKVELTKEYLESWIK